MHITVINLWFVLTKNSVIVAVCFRPFFFLLVITPCGWRLGKRRLQQPITVVSLSRRRVPSVCGPSLQSEKHPLCCGSPICQDHSFQIGVTLSRGLVSAFQRAMIAAKADKKKPKCRRSLISFEESYLPLVFCTSLSHDPISLSFKVFWRPIDLSSFTPWFLSLLMSVQLFIISSLSGPPVHHHSLPVFLLSSFPSWHEALFFNVRTTPHRPHVNM